MEEDEGGLGGGCGDGVASAVAGPEEEAEADASVARAGVASEVGGGSVWK